MTTRRSTIDELTDEQVLEKTGHGRYGPSIIGEELHKRSQEILARTDNGRIGPAITGGKKPSAAAPAAVSMTVDDYDGFKRNVLLKLARDKNLPVAPTATRDEIVDALLAANIAPPDGL